MQISNYELNWNLIIIVSLAPELQNQNPIAVNLRELRVLQRAGLFFHFYFCSGVLQESPAEPLCTTRKAQKCLSNLIEIKFPTITHYYQHLASHEAEMLCSPPRHRVDVHLFPLQTSNLICKVWLVSILAWPQPGTVSLRRSQETKSKTWRQHKQPPLEFHRELNLLFGNKFDYLLCSWSETMVATRTQLMCKSCVDGVCVCVCGGGWHKCAADVMWMCVSGMRPVSIEDLRFEDSQYVLLVGNVFTDTLTSCESIFLEHLFL